MALHRASDIIMKYVAQAVCDVRRELSNPCQTAREARDLDKACAPLTVQVTIQHRTEYLTAQGRLSRLNKISVTDLVVMGAD